MQLPIVDAVRQIEDVGAQNEAYGEYGEALRVVIGSVVYHHLIPGRYLGLICRF